MTKVKDMANITGRGPARDDSVESNAYLLWLSINAKKPRDANSRYYQGRPGWEHPGSLTTAIFFLWPGLSSTSRERELHNFRSDLYVYLRRTVNARCLQRGHPNGSNVLWWIADEWQASPSSVTLIHSKPVTSTSSEKRVTPEEAGEDRKPTAVISHPAQKKTEDTMARKLSEKQQKGFTKHQQEMKDKRKMLVEMAYDFVSKETGGQPVVCDEIASVLDVHSSTGRSLAKELVANGRFYTRLETKDERATRFGEPSRASMAAIYSTINPVPPRTARQVCSYLAVREPPTGKNPDISRHNIESVVLQSISTSYQPVFQLADRTGIPLTTTRAVLKNLLKKGLIEEKYHSTDGGPKLISYRLPGGTRGGGVAARNQYIAASVKQSPSRGSMPASAQQAPVLAPLNAEVLPQSGNGAPDIRLLMIAIQNLVTQYVSTVKPDTTHIEQLEWENTQLKAQVTKLEATLAPLRQLQQALIGLQQ